MPKRERFYVREHSGFPQGARSHYRARPVAEYMVIDRDYCHRVIRSWPPRQGWPAGQRAALAVALAERLNREDT